MNSYFKTGLFRRTAAATALVVFSSSIAVYVFLRFVFFDFRLSLAEEISCLSRLIFVAALITTSVLGVLVLIELADVFLQKKYLSRLQIPGIALAIILLIALTVSCNKKVVSGIKKDLTTGLTTTYNGMEPEKAVLVMNDEVLNHTDIPIGESFMLVNENISGLTVNNGKVKVGCELRITDKNGKTIFENKDLFKEQDEYNEKDSRYLKCTVNTGEPMKWEEKYNVAVTFWDKQGTGKVVNTVTIRMIDMP